MLNSISRRGFLAGLAVLLLTPALSVFAEPRITLWGDGIHDDTDALNAWGRGDVVYWPNGEVVGDILSGKDFLITGTVRARENGYVTSCSFRGRVGTRPQMKLYGGTWEGNITDCRVNFNFS